MISKPQAQGDIYQEPEGSLLEPKRWDLPLEIVSKLSVRLMKSPAPHQFSQPWSALALREHRVDLD